MQTEQALDFLWRHQPMPPDNQIEDDLIKDYDEVQRYFQANPDVRCIPLFLHSFGEGSGFGLYQLVDEVLKPYPTETVLPHLFKALGSEIRSIQYWSADVAASFPDVSLLIPLGDLLHSSDPEIREAAVTALLNVDDPAVESIFYQALKAEHDESLRLRIADAINFRQKNVD